MMATDVHLGTRRPTHDEAGLPRGRAGMRTSALGITFVNNQPRVMTSLLLCIPHVPCSEG